MEVASVSKNSENDDRWSASPAIRFSHATNSKKLLEEAITQRVNMIETDVLVSSEKTIITSHDALESDLLLSELLERVSKYNQNFPDEAIGVKLDFKDPAAVSGSIDLVNKIWIGQKAPIWLNADILLGPGGKPSRFDAKQFIESAIKKCLMQL